MSWCCILMILYLIQFNLLDIYQVIFSWQVGGILFVKAHMFGTQHQVQKHFLFLLHLVVGYRHSWSNIGSNITSKSIFISANIYFYNISFQIFPRVKFWSAWKLPGCIMGMDEWCSVYSPLVSRDCNYKTSWAWFVFVVGSTFPFPIIFFHSKCLYCNLSGDSLMLITNIFVLAWKYCVLPCISRHDSVAFLGFIKQKNYIQLQIRYLNHLLISPSQWMFSIYECIWSHLLQYSQYSSTPQPFSSM